MIKLFRKIRYELMSKNKTTKYFKYAIGEIILVVIGILIALQINNWNEKRKNKLKETALLQELNKEFIENKKQFDSVVYYHNRSFKSVSYIKNKLPLTIENENLDSLSYHLFYMGWTYTFNPSNGVSSSIINNANFDIISNDELRKLLISWNDVVNDYIEEELYALTNYQNHLKHFEKKYFYWDEDYTNWLSDKRLDYSIFNKLEFDNYVLDRYNDLYNILKNPSQELSKVSITMDKIIKLSDPKFYD